MDRLFKKHSQADQRPQQQQHQRSHSVQGRFTVSTISDDEECRRFINQPLSAESSDSDEHTVKTAIYRRRITKQDADNAINTLLRYINQQADMKDQEGSRKELSGNAILKKTLVYVQDAIINKYDVDENIKMEKLSIRRKRSRANPDTSILKKSLRFKEDFSDFYSDQPSLQSDMQAARARRKMVNRRRRMVEMKRLEEEQEKPIDKSCCGLFGYIQRTSQRLNRFFGNKS